MSLGAGTLNRQIAIQSQGAGGLDALRQPTQGAWTNFATPWANIKGQTGMGAVRAAANGVSTPVNRYSFRIRYRRDILVGMRVLHDSIVFDIVSIQQDLENHEWTDLVCEAGGNDG